MVWDAFACAMRTSLCDAENVIRRPAALLRYRRARAAWACAVISTAQRREASSVPTLDGIRLLGDLRACLGARRSDVAYLVRVLGIVVDKLSY